MLLNADFTKHAVVIPDNTQWTCSPQPGVERIMLDRIGHEQARATSLVRYAPHSVFPMHSHPRGEEILVLSGTFTENGTDYPSGWYLRNPVGSSHQPSSHEGTTIFVKLRQMVKNENQFIRIDTNDRSNWRRKIQRDICPLYSDDMESVALIKLAPGERLFCSPVSGGAEILLLEGEMTDPNGIYQKGSWLRFPPGDMPALIANAGGVTLYLKTGHLNPATLTGVFP